jgi:hypothetical protein
MKTYVTVFNGQEVPKGATHQASDTSFVLFAKWIGNHPVFFDVRNDSWVEDKLIGRHFFKELPEAKWEPIVGEECYAAWLELPDGGSNDYRRVIIKAYSGKQVWFTDLGGLWGDVVMKITDCIFRPLKTAKELDREAFVECVRQLLPKSDFDDLKLAVNLYDLGFTAPKEAK